MPRGKPIPNRAEVIAAMDGTRTAQEIADQFGMLRTSVYTIYLDQHGRGAPVKLLPMGSKPRWGVAGPTRVAQLVALADGTRTRAQIAEAMGISVNSLASYEDKARKAGHKLLTKKAERGDSQWRQIADFCADGTKTRQEVADHFGITRHRLTQVKTIAKQRHGVDLRFAKDRATFQTRKAIDEVVADLPAKVREWLIARVPAGGTMADLLRAFIVDAYHDEVAK